MQNQKVPFLGFEFEKNQKISEVRSSGKRSNYLPNKGIHRHGHYEILLIKKGGGKHIVDFREYDVCDNQVFFLRPGQVHQFLPSIDSEFYFVAIDSDEISLNSRIQLTQFEFFQSFYSSGVVIFDEIDSLIQLIDNLQLAIKNAGKHSNDTLIVSSYTVIFLIELQQKFLINIQSHTDTEQNSSLVTKFNMLLDKPGFNKRFVKDYAKELFVTPNYLNEKVKSQTGKPASFWIHKKILTESKRLLLEKELSLKEVAIKLNFVRHSHFDRFFKEYESMTPSEFKSKFN